MSSSVPYFSVIIPLYNKAPHIARALQSVADQTFTNYEIIVVDDGSTDGGVGVVNEFQDARVRLVHRSPPGPGGYAARNLGIQLARADWIAFLDADDEWYRHHLEEYHRVLGQYPDARVLACGWDIHKPTDGRNSRYRPRYYLKHHSAGTHVVSFRDYLRAELERRKPIHTSTACIARETLLAVGGFPDGRTRRGGDVDTWLRCVAHAGSLTWSNHVGGVYYRTTVNMVSHSEVFTAACERETVRTLLEDSDRNTSVLLKRFANSRTKFAWDQSRLLNGRAGFRLADKLYISGEPVRALWWIGLSLLPGGLVRAVNAGLHGGRRAIRRSVGRAKRHPVSNALRRARMQGLRLKSGRFWAGPVESGRPVAFLGDHAHETFFGYHDKTPVSADGRRLLAGQVPRGTSPYGRAPAALTIGYFPVQDEHPSQSFVPLAETAAWCWQQGCMLQWDPSKPSQHIVFNGLHDGAYASFVVDVDERATVARYDRAVYALDKQGRWAASINFSRLERLRPGYGYACLEDATHGVAAPEDDGVFLLDRATGASELVVSLSGLAGEVDAPQAEHYVNHVSFSPDGNLLVFFHLWTESIELRGRFCALNLLTGKLMVVESWPMMVSHYCWQDSRRALATVRDEAGNWRYSIFDLGRGVRSDLPMALKLNGHPMFAPCGSDWIITDTYPDRAGDQSLLLANVKTGSIHRLATFYSPFSYRGTRRCDLHPRWDRDGRYVVVDTVARGHREMALIGVPEDRNITHP